MSERDIVVGLAVFAAVCTALVVVMMRIWERKMRRIRNGPAAMGTVLSFEKRIVGRGIEINQTVVRFRIADGRTLEVRSGASGNSPAHAVGEVLPLHYDPARPESFVFDGDAEILHRLRKRVFIFAFAVYALILAGIAGYLTSPEMFR